MVCGVMIYDKGEEVYEGEFVNNRREGKGRLIYENGSVYEGEWKDDEMNGRGVLKTADGDEYTGEWVDG